MSHVNDFPPSLQSGCSKYVLVYKQAGSGRGKEYIHLEGKKLLEMTQEHFPLDVCVSLVVLTWFLLAA